MFYLTYAERRASLRITVWQPVVLVRRRPRSKMLLSGRSGGTPGQTPRRRYASLLERARVASEARVLERSVRRRLNQREQLVEPKSRPEPLPVVVDRRVRRRTVRDNVHLRTRAPVGTGAARRNVRPRGTRSGRVYARSTCDGEAPYGSSPARVALACIASSSADDIVGDRERKLIPSKIRLPPRSRHWNWIASSYLPSAPVVATG